jgi:cephalosporin hydroxylase
MHDHKEQTLLAKILSRQGALGAVVVFVFVFVLRRSDGDDAASGQSLVGVYRRQLEEMRLALVALRNERPSSEAAGALQVQIKELQNANAQLERQLELGKTRVEDKARASLSSSEGRWEGPIGHITIQRMPLVSDLENWALRPKRAPTFAEMYKQLYATDFSESSNVVSNFVNPYNLQPNMNYPASSLWKSGTTIMERVFQEIGGADKIRFVVEAGSMHGGSSIKIAMELDKRGRNDVPILCIDTFSGDLNNWLNRDLWQYVNVRDGRATIFDQFMVNVRQAIADGSISSNHISAFQVDSIVGARWLQATAFTPQLIFLDPAHEIDETYTELTLFWSILEPGGILMGDGYSLKAVKLDLDRFVRDNNLKLQTFGVFYTWYIKKAALGT